MEKQLSIFRHEQEIIQALEKNRVVVINGKTGCGKSTQIPKLILRQLPHSIIAICQPRRLAASSLAMRVSQELNSTLGSQVGYQIGMESKKSSNTQICFMTYGILIQQLLFQTCLPYTHIILDQVHERSLEMDFLFIALKKILDKNEHSDIKLVIMSATFDATEFSKYFSVHLGDGNNKFYQKKLNNFSEINTNQIKLLEEQKNNGKIKACQQIKIIDKPKYRVKQYFLDELEGVKNILSLKNHADALIPDSVYRIALMIVKGHLSSKKGDILIFLPGMAEIKKMKEIIFKQTQASKDSVIEVHSAYSDDIQKYLFDQKITKKIILATNIGESSITLPFCQTAIDFCLTRKCVKSEKKGYSKFQTRLASRSSLLQRAGRIGRNSDGELYRLISKQTFKNLAEFQIPEIQCVSLEMVILQSKQIDKNFNSKLFQDPYDTFLNAINPPKIEQISLAIKNLVKEGALVWKICKKSQKQKLEITQIGQFMASMPCDIHISKMILFSYAMGLSPIIIDIAAIFAVQKSFFIQQQKRENMQSFIHHLVDYDEENYNDFLLHQQIFSHWRELYFLPFFENSQCNLSQNHVNEEGLQDKENVKEQINYISSPNNKKYLKKDREMQVVINKFTQQNASIEERNWCSSRAISTNGMREILKISENIRQRLRQNKFPVEQWASFSISNLLTILCISVSSSQDTIELDYQERTRRDNKKLGNSVSMIDCQKVTEDCDFQEYLSPLKLKQDYSILRAKQGVLYVAGPPAAISKLTLPKFYARTQDRRGSKLFKHLVQGKNMCVSYIFEEPKILDENGNLINILNDSINRALIRPQCHKQYSIFFTKILETKGKHYLTSCALVNNQILLLIKMMTTKITLLQPHSSRQFYAKVKFQQENQEQLSFYLHKKMLKVIKKVRAVLFNENLLEFCKQVSQRDQNLPNQVLDMMKNVKRKPKLGKWNKLFEQEIEEHVLQDIHYIPIEEAKGLILPKQNQYFSRFQLWKQSLGRNLNLDYGFLTTQQEWFICEKCWPNKLTKIQEIHSYVYQQNIFNLKNKDLGWRIEDKSVLCSKEGHLLGKVEKQGKIAKIQHQNLLLYRPYKTALQFNGEKIVRNNEGFKKGLEKLHEDRSTIQMFECKICIEIAEDTDHITRKVVLKTGKKEDFWGEVTRHMESSQHRENFNKFMMFE